MMSNQAPRSAWRRCSRWISAYADDVRAGWDRFFFDFSAPVSLAVFRIFFGLTLLLNVVLRMLHTDFYFSDAGGVPASAANEMLPDFFRPAVTWFPETVAGAWAVQIIMVVGLLVLITGVVGRIGSRITAVILLACHLALMQRNISIVYGADIVTSFWLFGLCFTDSTERLSWRANSLPVSPPWSRILTSVGLRLLQIQLCVIYMYTGFEKLKGGDWWDQTAVWKVLGNEQLMLADLSFLRSVPLVIGLATWGTVLFEVYAPALFWSRAHRKWALLAGWLLHIGIAFTMGLFIFSLTMMSCYFLFIDSRWLEERLKVSHHVRENS